MLCAGLLALHGIFLSEREDAVRALDARERAVARAAQQALAVRLHQALEDSRKAAARAMEDPLADEGTALLISSGLQRLPRAGVARPDAEGPSRALWEALERDGPRKAAQGLDEDDPFRERLLLTDGFLGALQQADRPKMEVTFRALLSHRARYAVSTAKDAAATCWILERFAALGAPDRALLQGLVREGLQGERGTHLPGLQRLLLERREQLEAEDFRFLTGKVVALSERSGVEADDFAHKARRPPAAKVAVMLPLPGPSLLEGGWYAEPDGEQGARGVAVDADALVERVFGELHALGLLEAGDRLQLQVPDGGAALASLAVELHSPATVGAREAVRRRHALKAGLLLGSALLGVGLLGFAALAQSRKRRLVALRGELLATVSHELRTPLSAIRVMAETLERRAAGVPGVGDYPTRIVAEADGLGRLVENILAFNRLEKGRLVLRTEQVPLAQTLEAVADEVRGHFSTALTLELEGVGEARVKADPELLRILLSNLLHNACRHARAEAVVVRVAAREEAGKRVVQLSDDGPGIPAEAWERVFGEFERLPGASQAGSGLGLAICRRIVRLHGGELRISAAGPGGTTFEVSFPK